MRITSKPTSAVNTYRVFAPGGKNKAFRIMERSPLGQFISINDKHPRYSDAAFRSLVTAFQGLNRGLKTEQLSLEACKVQVQLIVEQLYRLDGVKFRQADSHGVNASLVEEYLAKRIDRKKTKQVSKVSARQYMFRAAEAIGNVSLRTAPIEEIQDALDKAYTDHRQRALATKLNALLKFAGRHDVRVEPNRPTPLTVRYIEFKQLEPILAHISEPAFAVMCQMALYTGLRIGELMAVTARDLNRGQLRVLTQIDTLELKDKPKWGKERTVAVFTPAIRLFPKWLKLRDEISHEVRLRAARIFKDACRKAYPSRRDLWLNFHDLRHSFAIRCLEQGLSLEMIAKQLGNSVRVCEMYYVGFVHTNTTLEQTAKLLNRPV